MRIKMKQTELKLIPKPKRNMKRWTDEEKRELAYMYRKGFNRSMIASLLERSLSSVDYQIYTLKRQTKAKKGVWLKIKSYFAK